MKFFPVFITFSHFSVRTRFYYNVLIKAENMRMCFLLLNCEKKEGMKAKKSKHFWGQELRFWAHWTSKASLPDLNNTLTFKPAGDEVHYWDTTCHPILEENRNKTKNPQKAHISLHPYQFHNRNPETSSPLMWDTSKNSCSSLYNNAGKLYGSWITAYLLHVYPAAVLKGKTKTQVFFWC